MKRNRLRGDGFLLHIKVRPLKVGAIRKDSYAELSSMEIQKLYRIIVDVQYGDMLDECDKLYDGKGYGTVFTDANGEAVIDYLKQWDSGEWTDDDIRSEEPRWVNNGTDSVHQKDGYTLIYNSTIGGVYMLYREANDAEIEWYNKLN